MVREGKRNDRLNILGTTILKRIMFDQCSMIFDLFL